MSRLSITQSNVSKMGLQELLLQDVRPVCIQKPDRDCTALLQHWEKTSKCCICTRVTSSLCLQLHSDSPNWPSASSSTWKKTIASTSPYHQRPLPLVVTLCHEYWVLEEGRECHCRFTFTKQDELQKDFIPVHMLTTEIPADSTSVAEFRKATVEDTTSGLQMQEDINGWPESRKDCHVLCYATLGMIGSIFHCGTNYK